MRAGGTIVAILGLAVCLAFSFLGCGSLFAWNGKHVIDVHAITPGTPTSVTLSPEPGRRYTAAVQIVFERSDAEPSAKMPITARAIAKNGATLAETTGWIAPQEPPTMLFGTHPSPRQADTTELVAERLVGSFNASTRDPIDIRVDLGTDANEPSERPAPAARVLETRLVLYDDVTPPSIKRALGAAFAGGLAFVVGVALVFVSFFRGRARRGGIRRR